MNFNWTMTEEDWINMKETEKRNREIDFFGNCYVGGVIFDFQHTLDESDWYSFINCFYVKENSGYGVLEDGTEYDVHSEAPVVSVESKTFEEFKNNCEKVFECFINENDDLKNLVNVKTDWYCI